MAVPTYKPITRESIIAFIKANPDRTNPRTDDGVCRYAEDDGTPSCVIGNILADAGYDVTSVENLYAGAVLRSVGALDTGDAAARLATNIQEYADSGATWGKALACALNREKGF